MALFSAFWGSSMPKRLIRYALSQIDLLDQDAVDLENLDLAWGRNTVVEFRDVGIRVDKLQSLLKLPETFSILRAKVLLVRLNIPVDLYSSPITVEISGVQVQLKVASKSKEPTTQKPGQVDADVIPNAANLAQSFLKTQPLADKKKLEDAIVAEAKDLGASMEVSDSEDDDDLTYGTGQALTLPTFVADFLQGIVDRIQIQIQTVVFQLDVEVPVEPNSAIPDMVTFELSLESIDVEGVTSVAQAQGSDGEQRIVPREGKRHISLNKVRAFLISEANVFTLFARSPSMPSSMGTYSPVLTARSPPSRGSSDLAQSIAEATEDDLYGSTQELLHDSEDAFNIPYDYNDLGSDPEDDNALSSPSTPRASMYQPFRGSEFPAQSEVMDRGDAWASIDGGAQSEPGLPPASFVDPMLESTNSGPPSQPASEPLTDELHGDPDELAKSHVFTHEDAESMYMSAFSEMNPSSSMPGGWECNESSTEDNIAAVEQPLPDMEASVTLPAVVNLNPPQPPNARSAEGPLDDSRHTSQFLPDEMEETQPEEHGDAPLPQDEASTPRGPARLAKEIVSLESISVYIPSNHKHLVIPVGASQNLQAPLEQSMAPDMPGAFSVHAASLNADLLLDDPNPKEPPVQPRTDGSIEIDLAPLQLQFDASIGFLLAKVIGELLAAVQSSSQPSTHDSMSPPEEEAPVKMPNIKLDAKSITLNFLETLPGISDTAERILGSSHAALGTQTLLTTCLSGLSVAILDEKGVMNTNIDIMKFTFGYPEDPILAFNQSIQMQTSIRDAFPSAGNDVSIRVQQSGGVTKCNINTLPLLMRLDLLRLDETFGWFGGLSSFLNLGSSMSSSSSPTTKNAPKPPQKRSVRFEATVDPQPPEPAKLKVDMRIGSFHLDLIGKDCSAVLRSSAIKVIIRDSTIGVGITIVRLDGPYKPGQGPPACIILNSLRLEYQLVPQAQDLERLLNLITPSKFKFDKDYDEIMVDPLLRQRRKGSVLRVNLDSFVLDAKNLAHLDCLPSLGEDLARLALVTRYLPEDDRPGLLTFVKVAKLELTVSCGGRVGTFQGDLKDLEVAHISLPMLVALSIGSISILRNQKEDLVGHSDTPPREPSMVDSPVLMARYIGNEIDPVVKIKLRDLRVEYRVPTIMDLLNLSADATPQDFEAAMAQSVANLGDQAHAAMAGKGKALATTPTLDRSTTKQTKVDVTFMDCLVGLNPLRLDSRMVVVLTDAHLAVHLPQNECIKVEFDIGEAGVVLIDDVAVLGKPENSKSTRRRASNTASRQTNQLCKEGYVSILHTSSAKVTVDITGVESEQRIIVAIVQDDLLVLETCADSTQTLIALANSLAPPTPPSKQVKFRTNIPLVENLMASISGEAFGKAEGDYDFETDFGQNPEMMDSSQGSTPGTDSPLDVQSRYLGDEGDALLFDAEGSHYSDRTTTLETNDGVLLTLEEPPRGDDMSEAASDSSSELIIQDQYFGNAPEVEGTAHKWDSVRNTYDNSNMKKVQHSPLKISVKDIRAAWNLYDGYDWARTRTVLIKAVEEMEARTFEKKNRNVLRQGRGSLADSDIYEEDDGTEVGDMLFNSIYIAIPSSKNPQDLAIAINQQLGDNGTETESIAASNVTSASARAAAGYNPRSYAKKLKLNRSRRHKIAFQVEGLSADVVKFPVGSGETQNSIDIRIQALDIYDHIPTSTWKKFATYDRDAGEREMGTNMVHIELLNVKPVPDLAASELVLKVKVLPLRLHVDQDALEFITRFFEFKDSSAPIHVSESDIPFIQRIEVASIPVKLDFKPKRVDYLALRSGRTTEFMNFVVLEQSTLVLRHIIMYGILGFDRMGNTLNDLWTADVKRTQLPGVLAGLAPARSLVNVGSGFRDLVTVPIKEYQKDGRIVRSVRKGASAFVKKTGTEVIKLGAKLAIGTQYVLQGAEELLTNKPLDGQSRWDDDDMDEAGEKRQISLYADQPGDFAQGISRAYSSLSRDLSVARDAIIAIPTDVAQSRSATGAAKAILEKAPVLIFRPTIGATKAIGQTLLGVTNTIDKDNRRRVDDKYKR